MMTPVFQNLSKEQSDIYSLVLSATGIEYQIEATINGFDILTEETLVNDSIYSIELYLDENIKSIPVKPTFTTKFHTTYSGVFIAFLLFFIHWRINLNHNPQLFTDSFGSSASRILSGEYFRCITALFLHGSDLHLVGNMFGIIVFGTSVCSIAGTGSGWCMILTAGFLGNYFNACFYKTLHLSIGASTAVFGAVGILAGYKLIYDLEEIGFKATAFLPIGAGLGLLALLGSSPNSDIMAHFFGYIAGLLAGSFYRLFVRKSISELHQLFLLITSAIIIIMSWVRGHFLYF